jgi:hypothetical protein
MIRLSLLQFRAQAIIAVVTMAVYGALLAATGSMYTADALRGCDVGRCGNPGGYFTASLIRTPYLVLYLLSVGTILLAPAVIGLGISEAQAGPGGATFTLFALSVPGQPGAWLLSSGPVNAAGQATSSTPAATGASSGPRPRSTSALALALTGYFFRRLSRLS